MNSFAVTPIGHVRSPRQALGDDDWGNVQAVIELTVDFESESLVGLDAFSHAEVLFLFDQVAVGEVEQRARHPRENLAWPRVGIFAQRGKNRPNRLGATIVQITGVSGRVVHVLGLDAVDGTPVLDIKPVMAEFLPRQPVHQPAWATELMRDYWQASVQPPAHVEPGQLAAPGDLTGMTITLETGSRSEDVQFVREGLMAYNRTFVPDDGYLPLNIFLRTPDLSIVGGLLGETYWGWLHIDFVWLREGFRRQGFGERLLAAAEAEAARRGCHAVNLDTLSFQALPFYTARGYAVFGILEDHPSGHTRFFLRKELH